jgi:hypothetical protein
MLQESDSEEFCRVIQSLRDLVDFVAGCENSRGIIVGDDDGAGSGEDGSPPYIA